MAGKLDQEEETKAISDFKRSRNVEKKDRRVNTAFQDLRAVTEELVDEIFLLSIKPNEEKEKTYGSPDGEFSEWDESESERHNYCEMEDDQTFEEDHLEHVLAEVNCKYVILTCKLLLSCNLEEFLHVTKMVLESFTACHMQC